MKVIRATMAVVATGACLAVGTPAQAADRGPALVATDPYVVAVDEPTWVRTHWRTHVPICDFKLTADSGRGVRIGYPGNTGTHTSFHDGDTLDRGQRDHASFKVTAEPGRRRIAVLRLRATYRHDRDGECSGRTREVTGTLRLPVVIPELPRS